MQHVGIVVEFCVERASGDEEARLSVISWEGWKQTVQETSMWDGGCVPDVLSRRVFASWDLKKNFVAFS